MKADEDEDDDTTIGSSRYPCLPSLVALQQMRNRLHMAHDGKRLMKWSAMATGRELRKIAQEIDGVFKGFTDAMRNAFILLARCRYFYPNLNTMTTENVAHQAAVTVEKSQKSVTGVRITQFMVVEHGHDPFPFLGINQGGTAIKDAKQAWLELLKRLVMILELRTSFQLIELSNKSATKKSNVLGKIIIPKTELTIRYILAELEELEREEFFRLKKVLEVKYRHKKKQKKGDECPLCKAEAEEAAEKKRLLEQKLKQKCIVCHGPMKSDPKKRKDARADLQDQLDKIISITKEYDQKGIKSSTVDEFKLMAEQLRLKLRFELPPNTDVKKLCDVCKKVFKVSAAPSVAVIDEVEDTATEGDGVCNICDKHSVGPVSVEMSLPPSNMSRQGSRPTSTTPSRSEQKPSASPSVQSERKPPPPPTRTKSGGSEKSVRKPQSQQSAVCEKHTPEPDLELGVFETDVKEIVKIVRKRNEDGTITEEKMVIKIQKETRNPSAHDPSATSSRVAYQSSETSNKSDAYSTKKTIGLLIVPEARIKRGSGILREVNSYSPLASPIKDPLGRQCISSCSMVTIDNEFAQKLQDKSRTSNISNPYSNTNYFGVNTTNDTKKHPIGVLPREVKSYFLLVPSVMVDSVARCCKSSTNITSIDSISDTMAEQNKRKSAEFFTSTSAISNLDKYNIHVDSTADIKIQISDESARQVHSYHFPLATSVSDIINKYGISSISLTSIISRIGKLIEYLEVMKAADFAKVDALLSIQLPLSEATEEIDQENTIIETQHSKTTNEPKLKVIEEEMKESLGIQQFTKRDNEVTEKKNEAREPQSQALESIICKTNLKFDVVETENQEVFKMAGKGNDDSILTYSCTTNANNDSNEYLSGSNDKKIVFRTSQTSLVSNLCLDSMANGMATTFGTKTQHIIVGHRKVKSHFAPFSSPKATFTRYCISSTSMISVDNEFESVCKCLINNSDCNKDITSDLREYVTSSTEFDQLMDSFELNEYTDEASTSRNCEKSARERTLTVSEHTIASDSFMVNESGRSSE